jgi:outer membrane receptor protein involved in Fe transport
VLFSGAAVAGLPLSPENGSSFDYGFVYDPHWIPGLTVSADVWRIYLNDQIVRPDGTTIANFCFASSASPYCKFIVFANGKIDHMAGVGYVNLGRLDTDGTDLNISYRLPETAFGNFKFNLNATYIDRYDNTVPGAPVTQVAGKYNSLYGNFARVRGLGAVDWNLGPISATWTSRYIGGLTVPSLNNLHIGAWVQHNLSAGYNIEMLNTRIDVGIDNVFDKQPPLFYQAVTNANTDVNTYDTIGRFYWARATVKF